MSRTTHTYAILNVSKSAYNEIRSLLIKAGYQYAFQNSGEIDMHGIAVAVIEDDGEDKACAECGCEERNEHTGRFTCICCAETQAEINGDPYS